MYYDYARILIWANEVERSQKLINYAIHLKGIDKAQLYSIFAYGLETKRQYKLTLYVLDQAILETYNNNYMNYLKDEKRRIKKKLKLFKEVEN